MIEKPESFQQFTEDREDGKPYSDGLYVELHRKLQETRDAIEKSGALNVPMVNWGTDSLYSIQSLNQELDQKNRDRKKRRKE